MKNRRRTTAVAVAGGVALASAAFAAGSQIGDGSAVARDGSGSRSAQFDGRHGGPGRGLSSLAERLGVSEAKLRDALDAIRPQGDPHEELAAALASALGVEESRVTEALEQLRSGHERRDDRHAAALARELGIEAGRVREAFEEVKPDGRRGMREPSALLADLAKELGVTQARLRAAMREVGPPGPGRGEHRRGHRGGPDGPGGPGGPGGPLAEDVATALGVDAAKVREALEDIHQQRHDEMAQRLADELGIDVDKVKEALAPRP